MRNHRCFFCAYLYKGRAVGSKYLRKEDKKVRDMQIYVPLIDLIKSEPSNKMESKTGIIGKIRGLASTPDLDYQGEKVVQKGLDIRSFLKNGFLNLDHDNSRIVGYPDSKNTKITKDGLYLEGYLLDNSDGRRFWETAIALQKSGTSRRLGFSIEGQILKENEKGQILKARVTNVAVTSTPCNANATWNAVVKSMTANTTSASPLLKESLECGKLYYQKALEGDREVLESLNTFKNKLNKSDNEDDIRLYLMMFKGLYGEDMANKARQIINYKE